MASPESTRPHPALTALIALWVFGVSAFFYLRFTLLLESAYGEDFRALVQRWWGG